MNKIKSIAVFCSASFDDRKSQYYIQTLEVGKRIGQGRFRLVYGGSETGLMGAVARSALKNGAKVLGVTTPEVLSLERPLKGTKVELVKTLQERKRMMIQEADAFIILGGGIGTIDEVFDVLVGQQINEHKKPMFLVNTNNFFVPLVNYVTFLSEQGFLSSLTIKRMKINLVKDAAEAFEQISKINNKGKINGKTCKATKTINTKTKKQKAY